MGGGRYRAPRPFGYYVVMIAHARARGRLSMARPAGQRRKASPALMGVARGVPGVLLPWTYKLWGRGRDELLT
jgi:hypothetical protein